MKAQVNQGKSAEKTSSSGTMESPGDHKNVAGKTLLSYKVEIQDEEGYDESNRSSGVRLRIIVIRNLILKMVKFNMFRHWDRGVG